MAGRKLFASGMDTIRDEFRFKPSADYRLLFRLSAPGQNGGQWKIEHFLQSQSDPSLMHSVEEVWERSTPLRLVAAQKLAEAGTPFSRAGKKPGTVTLTPDEAYAFLKTDAFALQQRGFGVQIPKSIESIGQTSALHITASLKNRPLSAIGRDALLEFDYRVAVGGCDLSESEFEAIAASKCGLVQVRSKWVEINPEDAARVAVLLKDANKPQTVAQAVSFGFAAAEIGAEANFSCGGKKFDSVIDAVLAEEKAVAVKAPEGFRGRLRPYQERGVGWLDFLARLGFGALLADDMGLGKTVQVIAHCVRRLHGGGGPVLVLCPTSVINNWQAEFARFAPGVRVKVHHGVQRSAGPAFARDALKAGVVVTSYALAWRDESELSSVEWDTVVLDEAQNIKNPLAKQTANVNRIRARHRIALTGTPVENRLSDLWSVIEFLNPGYLLTWRQFQEKFAKPIESQGDESKKRALKSAVSPFLLRRVKTDKAIISDLPQKTESCERCLLTPEQATLYKAVADSSLQAIEGSEGGRRRMEVLAAITKLKQICNHPANFLKDSKELAGRSGKVERLRELLSTMLANGESCLVFSQYTEMASLLYENLRKEFSAPFFYLHGGLSIKQRDEAVREFQESGEAAVFVLSLKAGGFGLNLTRASNVIHFDRWWNPAVESQATDRAFRIGQKKNVFVYKLTTNGTIEERIMELLQEKKKLADSVVGAGEGMLTELDGAKLREIFELRQ